MHPWIYGAFAAVLVALATAVVTYYATVVRMTHKAHEMRIEAVRERTIRETREELFSELHPEQNISVRTTGLIVRKKWLVISERLRYRDLPISGWVEHEILLDEELDKETLKAFAENASLFLPPAGNVAAATAKLVARRK
jgi:hypothetical protein